MVKEATIARQSHSMRADHQSDAGCVGECYRWRRPHHFHPPATDHQPGLPVSGRWHSHPFDRFFNHNALYEINLPQSGGVEVNKGAGHGAVRQRCHRGVINVLTRVPSLKPSAETSIEARSGWTRGLFSLSGTQGNDGVRAISTLPTPGLARWHRLRSAERHGALGSCHRRQRHAETVLTASNIDRDTAGSSTVSWDDYRSHPAVNYTPISFRKVQAARLSTAYGQEDGARLVSDAYLRYDSMDLLATGR